MNFFRKIPERMKIIIALSISVLTLACILVYSGIMALSVTQPAISADMAAGIQNSENINFHRMALIVAIGSIIAIIILVLTMLYITRIYKRLSLTKFLLFKSQERLESLIEETPVGIVIVNVSKKKFHANKKALELLQSQIPVDGDLSGRENLVDAAADNHLLNSLQLVNAIRGEKNIGHESFITVGDSTRPLRVSAIPIYNDDKIEYAISVFDDITDIKKAEDELIEAKKLMEESLVLKEVFLANMSHEIRTPMNAILGFTDLLRKRNLGKIENEYVCTINAAGESLLRIIDDILDFSKLNANLMAFEEEPTNVREIVHNICSLFDQKAVAKGITLSYEHDEKIPNSVLADPVRLTQVITNIVSNAIKFTNKGSVKVSSEISEEDGDAVTIMFRIADTGIGIPENKFNSIFTRFEQVLENGTRGGTGLGLSIAKHIVELQGGKIFVESTMGQGSVFSFFIPFRRCCGDVPCKEIPETVKEENFDTKDLEILLVEDNQYNIMLLKGVFLNRNIIIDVAEDGFTALQKLESKEYHIILLDIELPDTNGYKLAAKIRAGLHITTPIIALTAHALAGEKEKCLAAGMNDYLTKPVKANLLFNKISAHTRSNIAGSNGRQEVKTLQGQYISMDYLKSISENNKDFEEEMIHVFIDKAVASLDNLKNAIHKNDYPVIARLAHNLKSILSILITEDVNTPLELIEYEAKLGRLSDNAMQAFRELSNTVNKSVAEAKELLKDNYSLVK